MPKTTDRESDGVTAPDSDRVGEPTNLDTLTGLVSGLAEAVSALTGQVNDLQKGSRVRAAHLPRARSPKEIISGLKRGEAGGAQAILDMADPQFRAAAFRPDDIVRLMNEDKLDNLRMQDKTDENGDVLGVVVSLMYRRRKDGLRKYKVTFPGVGDDGCMENEIELVQAAD